MTSKEALENLYEYTDYNDYSNKTLNIVNESFEKIEKDLNRLEEINEVWHKNETMESVDINGNHLQEVYDFIHRLCKENNKLKKAIEILKKVLDLRVDAYNDADYRFVISVAGLYEDASCSFECISSEQYELLKEVLGDD